MATFFLLLAQSLTTFVESLIVDRFGRRLLLVISGCGCAVGVGLTGLYKLLQVCNLHAASQYSWLPLFSLVLYIVFFSIGFAPIPWMMIPEMAPIESRSVIATSATALNWGSAFVITLFFPIVITMIQEFWVYFGFAIFTVIGTAFVLVCMPETSGKSLDQLRASYAYGWKNSLFSAVVSRRLSVTMTASNLNLPSNDQLRVTTM